MKPQKCSLRSLYSARIAQHSVLFLALWALLFVFCVSAAAQPPGKVARIGCISTAPPAVDSGRREAIRQALRAFGYIEGKNISMLYRNTEGDPARYPALLSEFINLKVDVIIVAGGSGPIRAAKNATKTIPIVMAGQGLDPVEAGLVESLARPGGNLTGFTDYNTYLGGNRLDQLKNAVPKITRVAVLAQANNPRNMFEFKEVLPASAQTLKLTMLRHEARDANDFERIFAVINKDPPDALSVLGGPLTNRNQERIAAFAIKSRLPSVFDERYAIDVGGLMFYGADLAESYQRVAAFVDKILKGRKPADLPIEQPTKFELIINLKTAKQIGLTIPQKVLARADKVIK
jgi:putative tryptophan/tyrosine transport system substrate-binding protein